MLIRDALSSLERLVPLAAAGYEKDALGLQVGYDEGTKLKKALVAYEVTYDVIEEAKTIGANLIVAYHPLIFPHISSLTDATRTGSLLRQLVKADIALYIVHTAFDSYSGGTSYLMADALGLVNITSLAPLAAKLDKIVVFVPKDALAKVQESMWQAGAGHIGNYDECSFSSEGIGTFRGDETTNPTLGAPLKREYAEELRIEMIAERWKTSRIVRAMIEAHPYEEVAYDVYPLANTHPRFGMGSIGELPEELSANDLLNEVKLTFGAISLRHNKSHKTAYSKIGMVGGAGMEYYSAAKAAGAGAFITGDIRYHDFLRAEHDGILLIDAGHAETERFVADGIAGILKQSLAFVNLKDEVPQNIVIASRLRSNAVRYY